MAISRRRFCAPVARDFIVDGVWYSRVSPIKKPPRKGRLIIRHQLNLQGADNRLLLDQFGFGIVIALQLLTLFGDDRLRGAGHKTFVA